jgi:dihydropyrimidinase
VTNLDLVVRNATVATAADVFEADIGIRDGIVAALGRGLPTAARELDATGLIVTPGGVDAHCHLDQPMSDGTVMADDFESGTISAAFGGTTTVIPFACQQRGQSLRAAVDDYHRRADGRTVIDHAFHLIVSDPTTSVLGQELPALIAEGYTSFKVYMTYDDLKLSDRQILDVMALARREGAMTMVHAENADCIEWLTEQLTLAGRTAPVDHAHSRPRAVEREATHRAVTLAEIASAPVLIVHVSSADAIEQIRRAQGEGVAVYAETCPQYLFLTERDLEGEGLEGARCICSPPPRDEHHQRAVWRGLANGTFQVFSSDHAPFRYQDPRGKLAGGPDAHFSRIPNGIPGLETRLPLLFSEGVGRGRIDLRRFVDLTATAPARLYGLYPRKGSIAIGADADLVLWDPRREVTVRNADLHHNVDYTPYEGMSLTGWPVVTISRGEIVCRDGELLGVPGRGSFLACERPFPVPGREGRAAGRPSPAGELR